MRKKLVTLSALLILFSAASVRAGEGMPFAIGFKGGLNLSNNSVDVSPLSKSLRTGAVWGGYGEIGLTGGLFVSGECLLLNGGSKLSYLGSEGTLRIDEVVVPVSLKYKFLTEYPQNPHPYFITGLNFGFVSTAEVEGGGTTTDIKDHVESNDMGWHLGMGVDFPTSDKVAITADVRYSLGLKSMFKGIDDSKSGNLSITLGINFGKF